MIKNVYKLYTFTFMSLDGSASHDYILSKSMNRLNIYEIMIQMATMTS